MNDIDFEELDRAINSVLSENEKRAAKKSTSKPKAKPAPITLPSDDKASSIGDSVGITNDSSGVDNNSNFGESGAVQKQASDSFYGDSSHREELNSSASLTEDVVDAGSVNVASESSYDARFDTQNTHEDQIVSMPSEPVMPTNNVVQASHDSPVPPLILPNRSDIRRSSASSSLHSRTMLGRSPQMRGVEVAPRNAVLSAHMDEMTKAQDKPAQPEIRSVSTEPSVGASSEKVENKASEDYIKSANSQVEVEASSEATLRHNDISEIDTASRHFNEAEDTSYNQQMTDQTEAMQGHPNANQAGVGQLDNISELASTPVDNSGDDTDVTGGINDADIEAIMSVVKNKGNTETTERDESSDNLIDDMAAKMKASLDNKDEPAEEATPVVMSVAKKPMRQRGMSRRVGRFMDIVHPAMDMTHPMPAASPALIADMDVDKSSLDEEENLGVASEENHNELASEVGSEIDVNTSEGVDETLADEVGDKEVSESGVLGSHDDEPAEFDSIEEEISSIPDNALEGVNLDLDGDTGEYMPETEDEAESSVHEVVANDSQHNEVVESELTEDIGPAVSDSEELNSPDASTIQDNDTKQPIDEVALDNQTQGSKDIKKPTTLASVQAKAGSVESSPIFDTESYTKPLSPARKINVWAILSFLLMALIVVAVVLLWRIISY